MPAKDFANTRYSELAQINTGNVAQLEEAFTVDTGTRAGQESAPIYAAGTLYFVTPFPNVLFAIDMTAPGGKVKWRFDPKPDRGAQGVACCEAVNRGPAFADGTIYFNTIDDQTIAVDANTGKPRWQVKLGDFTKGETMTMAPFVAGDKVLVGNSGAMFGVRGWLAALNRGDGSTAWQAYSTGPDKDVLIDPQTFKPFYGQYRGSDLGVESWPTGAWQQGGGTVWGWISYDPEQELVFHGTSNPSPWNAEVRPGDNLWTSGVFARELGTGKARWFYQSSPHDLWGHSSVNENIVLDLPWQGGTRKVIVRADRNGYVYVIDRTNGEVLAADAFAPVSTSNGIDPANGNLKRNTYKTPRTGETARNVCPAWPGAKDWSPSAFSKKTGLIYVPRNNVCMDFEPTEVSYISGTPYLGAEARLYPGLGGNGGAFFAWDPVKRTKVWEVAERWPVSGGAIATAGDLVFYGNLEGWLKALDARSGQTLWQFQTGSGIVGQPTTFKGPDGRQYVAVLSGIGGPAGSIVSGDIDPRDATAQAGYANMTAALKQETRPGGTLHVFALAQ